MKLNNMNTIILTILLVTTPLTTYNAGVNVKMDVKKNLTAIYDTVTLTTYTAVAGETDSTPTITASGFKIDTNNPKRHRIIAISRDLKKKWKFGTKVKIKNAGKYNGVYVVKDLMNKRYKNRVDILIGEDDKQVSMNNVKITKLN